MLISFILPVYNVGKWLNRCFDSIISQGIPTDEYEIIVVDDGSSDDSKRIIEEYIQSKKDDDISWHLISQSNFGASAARNAGLRLAKGEYIWWIDGDDCLAPECAVKLLNIMIKDKLDILNFAISILYDDGRLEPWSYDNSYVGKVQTGKRYICNVGVPPNVWSSIYRREFLVSNDLWLKEGIVHEDLEFPPRVYYMAERVSFSSVNSYYYYQREGSVMRTSDPKKVAKKAKDLLVISDSLFAFITDKESVDSDVYLSFMDKIAFAFSQSLRNAANGTCNVKDYTKREYYPLKFSDKCNIKDRIKYGLINFSVPLYLFMYKNLKK